MLGPMRSRPPSYRDALSANALSAVSKSETDMLNRTFRIRFIAHPRLVSGRAVVDLTSETIGRRNTPRLVKFQEKRIQMNYTTRGGL